MTRLYTRAFLLAALVNPSSWAQSQKAPLVERAADSLTMGVKIGEPGRIRTPAIENWKLANGMRVLFGVNAAEPLISGTLLLPAGSLFDPEDRVSLTDLAARVIQKGGGGKLDGAQMRKLLDEWGAQLALTTDESELKLTFTCLGRYLQPMLEMVAELLRSPRFTVEALEQARAELHSAVSARNQNPAAIAPVVFREALRRDSAAWPLRLQSADVDLIQIEDLRRFQQQHLRPGGAQLALTGDLELAAARALVETVFGPWEAAAGPPPPLRKPLGQPPQAVLLVRTPDAERAMLIAGNASLQMTDADFIPLFAAAQVLKGRIETAIERNPLWADWRTSFSVVLEAHPLRAGTLQIQGAVSTGSAARAVAFVQNQIPELLPAPVTAAELEVGKQRAMRSLHSLAEQEGMLFHHCAWLRFHQVGGPAADPLFQWQKDLAALTKDALERALKNYIRPAQFTFVVAGHAESFFPPLTGATEFDLSTPPARAPETTSTGESRRLGLVWLAKMRDGLGGEEKLASIRDYRAEYTVAMPGRKPVQLLESWMAEETFRQDKGAAGGVSTIFYNGKIGWLGQGRLVSPLPSSMLEQARGELFRLPFRLALLDKAKSGSVDHLGAGALELTGEHQQWARVQLDEETGLPRKTSYRMRTLAGALLPAEDEYSDWRNEGGVLWPGRILTRRGGSEFAEMRLVRIEWNIGLTRVEMEKKP